MKVHGNTQKRLTELRTRIERLRAGVRVLDEQVAYLGEQASEAETRALVSATPLADREHREAAEDLRRLRRERDENAVELAGLLAEQDRLLEKLLA